MSTIRYFERDGQRVELPPADQIREERRCDGCGQYLADDDAAYAVLNVDLRNGTPGDVLRVDAHRGHLGQAIAKALGG